MPLQKGQTNNPNGRPKGVRNKVTTAAKQKLLGALNFGLKRFKRDLMLMEPRDRVNATLKIAEFVLPKKASLDVNVDMLTMEEKQEMLMQIIEANEQREIQLTENGEGTYGPAEGYDEGEKNG